MKHYLIDTNVVIDMLTDRIGSDEACVILDGAERGEYVLHLCSLSVTNIYYSLRKVLTHQERINALDALCEVIDVLAVDKHVILMHCILAGRISKIRYSIIVQRQIH